MFPNYGCMHARPRPGETDRGYLNAMIYLTLIKYLATTRAMIKGIKDLRGRGCVRSPGYGLLHGPNLNQRIS